MPIGLLLTKLGDNCVHSIGYTHNKWGHRDGNPEDVGFSLLCDDAIVAADFGIKDQLSVKSLIIVRGLEV